LSSNSATQLALMTSILCTTEVLYTVVYHW